MSDYLDKLKSLIDLYEAQVLTAEEFEQAKAKLHDASDDVSGSRQEPSISDLNEHGWHSGAVIRGYQLTHFVGKGGFGVVWGARDADQIPVALKAVQLVDEEQYIRLANEIEILKTLESPYIVGLREAFQLADWMVVVQEFVEGATLNAFVSNLSYTQADIDDIAAGLMAGLEVIHQHQLVHRDIKPDNVLLGYRNQQWHPKIIDFGIVRRLGPSETSFQTQMGIALGTPGFMAPEQYSSPEQVDTRADIFALGAILFFLLTKKRAFRGTSHLDVLRKSCLEAYDHDVLEGAAGPERMKQAIRRALSVYPENRPQSIEAFRDLWFGVVPTSEQIEIKTAPFDVSTLSQSFPLMHHIVGRKNELEQVKNLLRTWQTVHVYGPPGIGKTALGQCLAVELSRNHDYVYIDLDGTQLLSDFYFKLADYFKIPKSQKALSTVLLQVLMFRKTVFLIVDGVFPFGEALGRVLEDWGGKLDDFKCLLLSRERIFSLGAFLQLGPLSLGETQQLFLQVARRHDPYFDITPNNQADVNAIIGRTEGVPIRVELLAPHVANYRPEILKTIVHSIFDFHDHNSGPISLAQTAEWSFEMLKEEAQSALTQLSIFEAGFTLDAAEQIVDLSDIQSSAMIMDVLHGLELRGWIRLKSIEGLEYMTLHDTMRSYLKSRAEEYDQDLRYRFIDYYRYYGMNKYRFRMRQVGGEKRILKLRQDLPNLRLAIDFALQLGSVDDAARCTLGLFFGLEEQGSHSDCCDLFEQFPVHKIETPKLKVDIYSFWGAQLAQMGQSDVAIKLLEGALSICEEHQLHKYAIYSNLSSTYYFSNDIEQSEYFALKALSEKEQMTEDVPCGRLYNRLGLMKMAQGEHEDAHVYFQAAIESHRQFQSQIDLGNALSNYSGLLLSALRYDDALEALFEAKSVLENARAMSYLAMTIGSIGHIYFKLGQADTAIQYHQKALQIHRELGQKRSEAVELCFLAELYLSQSEWELAEKCFEPTVDIFRSHHPAYCGVSMMAVAWLQAKRGGTVDYDYHSAYALSKNRLDSQIRLLNYAGLYYLASQNRAEAEKCFEQANQSLQSAGLESEAFWLSLLARLKNQLTEHSAQR